ncbi:glycosyltransferase [Tomitella fengzijianii]|uniref:Glycosyl transferase n=1 Tax=Tomitella fengzijianii TaxID=2597660 RepID=A0A516X854_9ACTN|nr:glycosyl transferase [Tomitella fengzijianii]QDQ99240.1 glycosyl transferase [Tomitella fengzijianii]
MAEARGERVVVIAGPEAGHAIPAMELCRRLAAAGARPVLMTGERWAGSARAESVEFAHLRGLAPDADDDDADEGTKLHSRAARMAALIVDDVRVLRPQLVVADTITVAGGMAAELLGIPWVELIPHPLYIPSRGLPPLGSGLAVGEGVRGRLRDALLRAATRPQLRNGRRQREAARRGIGLPDREPGPDALLVATLPALEPHRPDWPDAAYVVGPLVWDPSEDEAELPPGWGPLVLVAPSTATNSGTPMAEVALRALAPERMGGRPVRVVITTFGAVPEDLPEWARAGRTRQDAALREAAVVVCGAGHGMLAKAVDAGAAVVAVPGGGDQWELACRAERQGIAVTVRPLTEDALTAAVTSILDRREEFSAAVERARSGARRTVDPVEVCLRVARRG